MNLPAAAAFGACLGAAGIAWAVYVLHHFAAPAALAGSDDTDPPAGVGAAGPASARGASPDLQPLRVYAATRSLRPAGGPTRIVTARGVELDVDRERWTDDALWQTLADIEAL